MGPRRLGGLLGSRTKHIWSNPSRKADWKQHAYARVRSTYLSTSEPMLLMSLSMRVRYSKGIVAAMLISSMMGTM